MKRYINAAQLKEGDILSYGDGTRVTVERITEAQCDGAVGIHGNNDTWTSFYKPTDRVRIEVAGVSA